MTITFVDQIPPHPRDRSSQWGQDIAPILSANPGVWARVDGVTTAMEANRLAARVRNRSGVWAPFDGRFEAAVRAAGQERPQLFLRFQPIEGTAA
ncbi:hypothetical protein [Nocardiopsis rhodophaea]|uniref:hypothetical protein n=1 Tax=Nocardiopsis rhodophaea TaxID=280238 RepID=UPI0031D0EC06